VMGVTLARDERRIFSAAADASIKVWDLETGSELLTLRGHQDAIRNVSFLPDQRHLLSSSADHSIRIWDLDTGSEVLILNGHSKAVTATAIAQGWIISFLGIRRQLSQALVST
jgi:WD40 repeat protein